WLRSLAAYMSSAIISLLLSVCVYSLLSTHIRTFLHLGQCHAGYSPRADGMVLVCRVSNPAILFLAFSVSEVISYQLSKPAPTPSAVPRSISAPQSKHFITV